MVVCAEEFSQKIREALEEGLPGAEAQLRMAPAARRSKMPAPLNARDAAVLVLIYFNDDGPHLLLTQRKVYEGVHSGQVSFPGGKYEQGENDPVRVALRESFEETGVNPEMVEVIGLLSDLYIPPSNMLVRPVVAVAAREPEWNIDPWEVDSLLHIPLDDLSNPATIKQGRYQVASGIEIAAPYFALAGKQIWGATAMILSEFCEVARKAGIIPNS